MAKRIEVPDFKNVYEFDCWVNKLEDKEIQSWTTKDWLRMYEKLDKMQAQRAYPDFASLKDPLIKLNRNYRLEEADFKRMVRIGKKIGRNLAKQDIGVDLASINVNNDFVAEARKGYAQAVDKAVYESSKYAGAEGTPLGNYDKAVSEINIVKSDKIGSTTCGTTYKGDNFSSKIEISDNVLVDVFGDTPIHESVHAQLQLLRTGQQEALIQLGIKPNEGFSKDFYRLLRYNDKYYVNNTINSDLYNNLSKKFEHGEITEKEFEKIKARKIFKGYSKQPLETHAEIIGSVAEHYYRQETGQLSERTARSFAFLNGRPKSAVYNEKGEIVLTYDVHNKEFFDKHLDLYLDKETKAKISAVYNEKQSQYIFTIPADHKAKNILNHARKASLFSCEYGFAPNNIDYSQPDKIVFHYNQGSAEDARDVFEHNKFGKISEDNLKNIEIKPKESGGYTISVPKNGEETSKLILEMADIKKRLEEWNTTVIAANGAIREGKNPSIVCEVIPDNADLSGVSTCELNVKKIGDGVKLPNYITMKNIEEGMDLSSAQFATVTGKTAKNVKWPEYVMAKGSIEDLTDFSSTKLLFLGDMKSVGKDVKLPESVRIMGKHPPLDLSGVKNLVFDRASPISEDILPEKIEICNADVCRIPKAEVKFTGRCGFYGGWSSDYARNLSNCDLSNLEHVKFSGCVVTAETKLPSADRIEVEGYLEVKDRANLEKILQGDVSELRYIEVPSKEMMNGLEYPKNAVMGFEAEKTLYVPNENAMARFQRDISDQISEEIKIINGSESATVATEKTALKTENKVAEEVATGMAREVSSQMARQTSEELLRLSMKEQAGVAEETVSQLEKAATKTAMKAQAGVAGKAGQAARSLGKAATKTAQSAKETLLAVNKAYDSSFDAIVKWGNKYSPQWMNKLEENTVQKAAEKFMKSKSGQAIAKYVEQKVGTKVAASIAKKLPILCLVIGAACVRDRIKNKEYSKAVLEGVAAIAFMVPGPGTLAGLGIEGAVLADDMKIFEHGIMQADPNSHMVAESTGYDNKIKRMNELIEKQNKEAESQKQVRKAARKIAAEKTPQMMENLEKLAPWSNKSR